jgi:hypothetical protein
LQLPPVPETDEEQKKIYEERYEDKIYFFEALSFDISKFKIIELQKVYRQDDPVLIKALNLVRS